MANRRTYIMVDGQDEFKRWLEENTNEDEEIKGFEILNCPCPYGVPMETELDKRLLSVSDSCSRNLEIGSRLDRIIDTSTTFMLAMVAWKTI